MVNVARYDIVATGNSVTQCEQEYIRLLADKGVTTQEALPQTEVSGVIEEIRSAVLDGNTYYFLRLAGEKTFYRLSAAENETAVILNVGDTVTIHHEVREDASDILAGVSITLDKRGDGAPVPVLPAPSPAQPEPSAPAEAPTL